MKKQNHIIPIILGALCVLCLIIGILLFFWEHPKLNSNIITVSYTDIQEEANSNEEESSNSIFEKIPEEELNRVMETQKEPEEETPEQEILEAVADVHVTIEAVENPYKEYFLKNDDMIAWMKIPDTVVDYPVMWTPEDENYYLYKNFDKGKDKLGCLILDTDSSMDPLSTNLIVHGHNFSGVMFGDLHKYYATKESRDLYPYIYLYGKDYEHVYEVMAVFKSKVFYTTDTCFKYYRFFNATNEEEFNDFYENVKALQLYDTGVAAELGDKFLTLSTCSEHTENGRFVVVAKEIDQGDIYLPITENENSSDE